MLKQSPDAAPAAETIALQMLGFLASDGERLERFMATAGLTPQGLRAAAADPQFLAGVMDYLLADQSLLLAFAESVDLSPHKVMAARRHLPGFSP